jgi:methylase of polypeptide subunit release factors
MEIGDHLILATDLHPRVLSCTTVGTSLDGAVMYIGPDSLALVNHLPLLLPTSRILDLCTGSGVQALSALLGDRTSNALCVDINERALRFVTFNAALNGLADQVDVRQADLIAGTMTCSKQGDIVQKSLVEGLREASLQMNLRELTSSFDVILANPPFIPVPPDDDTILQRYGLFSSGGPDGEDVLKVVVQIASALLPPYGGLLGIVSEFMNPPISDEVEGNESLLRRIQAWWSNGPRGRGMLFTNEFPVDAETYGTRRADSLDERDVWVCHLSNIKMAHVSPGLLFISTDDSLADISIAHKLVPKSASGSLWTPANRDAVDFSRKALEEVLHPNATNASL